MTHPYFEKTTRPRVFAHRGLITAAGEDSGVWENSAAAFAAAHAAGAEYIETDCRVTASGDVVLFHDASLKRLTGDDRTIDQVPTRELAAIFADHGGLLTAGDAIDAFPRMRFNIDVKTSDAADPLGSIVAAHTHRVLVTSFTDSHRRAAVASALRAGAQLPPATSGGSATIAAVRACSALRLPVGGILEGIDALQIPERHGRVRVLTPALVRAAHRHGAEVHVWTINDLAHMRRLLAQGVDGIVTDRADVAVSALHL